ncbi:MAG: division/cell wall cluster transcriptional repressor MraZ [Anaerolineae bacterium]|nr:division/cell wall cluster transcriptional repressor MraZ [Anaerolineae bacterium]
MPEMILLFAKLLWGISPMFWGEYSHHLDKKGRLIIPVRYREKLTDEAILTRGLDNNLVIYPAKAWETVTTQLSQMPITHPSARALRRLLFSGAVQLALDKQGRVSIPDYLRDYATITHTILLVGMETYIELWEPTCWRATLDKVSSVIADSGHTLSLNL